MSTFLLIAVLAVLVFLSVTRWHRGHKASSLNSVYISSDCDVGFKKKEE